VIEEIRGKNRGVKAYRADVFESAPGGAAGRRVSLLKDKGTGFRLEMDLPEGGKYVMLSDGEQMLVWMPPFDAVWRSDLRRVGEELGPEAVRELDRDWRPPWAFGADNTPDDSLRYLGMEEIDGRRAYVLEGRAPLPQRTSASGTSSTQRVWINANTGFPERAVFCDERGAETRSQRFTNVVTNPTWHNNTFRLDVPAGVPTVDATDNHIEMIRQRRLMHGRFEEPPAE
jgi:outer membrane lipoprotein-sorting protein